MRYVKQKVVRANDAKGTGALSLVTQDDVELTNGMHGEVYEQGRMIGWAGISQVSIGAQIGGKSFAQVVFFETREQLDRFTSGNLEFGAGVDAVATDHNAALNTDYRKGVTVFIFIRTGLMADVSASGQQFTFVRK